jgi:curved DNA-binding protein CbpA
MTDLYEVLQVHRLADPDVIRAAYRILARKHHPDMGGAPARMAAINDAWAILGDQVPRAAYDAESRAFDQGRVNVASPTAAPAPSSSPLGRTGQGLSGRRPQEQRSAGSVLDFGRYAGWTVGGLADHHPDYLAWLARTPIGRSLSMEIDTALARRAAEAAALRPTL